jgi:hypothetical protein
LAYREFESPPLRFASRHDPTMSYARLSDDSNVYLLADEEAGYLRCVGCGADFSSTTAMIEHLRGHIASGDAVPDRMIPALEADLARNDPWLAVRQAGRR